MKYFKKEHFTSRRFNKVNVDGLFYSVVRDTEWLYAYMYAY